MAIRSDNLDYTYVYKYILICTIQKFILIIFKIEKSCSRLRPSW